MCPVDTRDMWSVDTRDLRRFFLKIPVLRDDAPLFCCSPKTTPKKQTFIFVFVTVVVRDYSFFCSLISKLWGLHFLKSSVLRADAPARVFFPTSYQVGFSFWYWTLGPHLTPPTTSLTQPTNQPTNQSTNQSTNQPINQPINQSTNQPINQSINQSTNQPINQSINQPTNRPTDQSTNKPINQSTNQSINQPINKLTNQSTIQSTNQPIDQPINQPTSQSTDQPINQSINQPINKTINQPRHLAPQNLWFSLGNPYILALLMGVDLSSMSDCRGIAAPHLTPQNLWFS